MDPEAVKAVPLITFERLSQDIIPIHYDLEIEPNWSAENQTFQCKEKIQILVTKPTKKIILNSCGARISFLGFRSEDPANNNDLNSYTQEASSETIHIFFDHIVKPGHAKLSIKFVADYCDSVGLGMKGFYRSKYECSDKSVYYNLLTFFAPIYARNCFPCFDEPALKATFNVSLIVPLDKVAISNMPLKSEEPFPSNPEKLRLMKFETSPRMSTYLVAWIIGEFDYLEGTTEDAVLCRVYTPRGKKEQGQYALKVAMKALAFYKEYFGLHYPLPKLDMVAIGDFPCGAMENWGVVSFRETVLLVDDQNTSTASRQSVAITVAHEIAHSWFGNLVTPLWWNDLWLNEGYASFMEFLCVDYIFPEYDIWSQFATDTFMSALELDGLKNSHPIEVKVQNPSEIDEIFDQISYNKGASIIRMLHHFIGDVKFRKGMHEYLSQFEYKNAETADLWAALAIASDQPIGEIMSTWTKQMGYPLVTVLLQERRENSIAIRLTQEKFWADPNLYKESTVTNKSTSSSYRWVIPLTFCRCSDPNVITHTALFDGRRSKEVTIIVPDDGSSDWLKVNVGGVGFYRVHYALDIFNKFLPAIKNKSMRPLDRLELLDDLLAIVRCGRSSTINILKLVRVYSLEEDNYTVWHSICNILNTLKQLLLNEGVLENLKAFVGEVCGKILHKVGWESKAGESHLQALLRSLIINVMIDFEHKETVKEANRRFELQASDEKAIPADIRYAVYKAVLLEGGEEAYNKMLKMYHESDLLEEKLRILRSFGAIKDVTLLGKVLKFSISKEVRLQDVVDIMISVSASKNGQDLTWRFFKEQRGLLRSRFPGGFIISRLVKNITENFTTVGRAQEIETFFKRYSFRGTDRTVQQALERIRISKAWLGRDLENIREFLSSYPTY